MRLGGRADELNAFAGDRADHAEIGPAEGSDIGRVCFRHIACGADGVIKDARLCHTRPDVQQRARH